MSHVIYLAGGVEGIENYPELAVHIGGYVTRYEPFNSKKGEQWIWTDADIKRAIPLPRHGEGARVLDYRHRHPTRRETGQAADDLPRPDPAGRGGRVRNFPQIARRASMTTPSLCPRGLNLAASRRSVGALGGSTGGILPVRPKPGNREVARQQLWPFLGCSGVRTPLPESRTPRPWLDLPLKSWILQGLSDRREK